MEKGRDGAVLAVVNAGGLSKQETTRVLRPDTTVQIDFFLSTVTTFVFKPTDILLLLRYKKGCLRCLLPPVVMETKQNGHQTTCK